MSSASLARNERRSHRGNRASTSDHKISSPPTTPTEPPKQYQPPFVEDVTTPVIGKPTGASSPLSSILRRDIYSSLSVNSSNVSSLSDGSAKSSTNKSVKFKEFVGVRRSRSPSSSGLSSDAKVEEAIKPDDDSTPKRPGNFGHTPVRDRNGKPVVTPACYSRKLDSDAGSYLPPNDGSPDHPWNPQPSPPPTRYNKGAFANMAFGGLGADNANPSPKWHRRGEAAKRAPSYSPPPGADHAATHDVYGGQGTYDASNAGFDGVYDEAPSGPYRPRRRSVFASFFDDAPEGYQGPTPSSPFRPGTPSSYGQAHPETARDS